MTNSALRKKPDLPPDLAPEKAQREASDPKASVWVGASAGSGKTTVLTSRVMRLLLDGVPPQKILCLTFTRAAAAEMAIRVTGQLSLWATCGEDELRQSLDRLQGQPPTPKQIMEARRLFARVLSCPGGMRVRTIHAFCQEILGRFPIEAGLPPHFAVIEEDDARELIEEAQDDLLRELQNAPKSALARALQTLVVDLSERGFASAMRGFLHERARIDDAVKNAGGLDQLILKIRGFLDLSPDETEQAIIRAAVDFAALIQADLRGAAVGLLKDVDTYRKRGEKILEWLQAPAEKRVAQFDIYRKCFLTGKDEPFVKFVGSAISKTNPDIDIIMRREATRLQTVLAHLDAANIAAMTEAILRFGAELSTRYKARKEVQAALDYDDLIIRTDQLLHRPGIAPWVLYKLDGGLDHILVDEAQDTSRAQWSIIKALADEFFGGSGARDNAKRTLFAVGDEKQSIFSFQNADPDAFAEMRNYFARRLSEADRELRSVGLHVSFRSAPAILTAVDEIFAAPRAQAGVSLEPIHHFPARPRPGEMEKIGRVEVWPLRSVPEIDKAASDVWDMPIGYEDEHDPQAALAAMIAEKIAKWHVTKEVAPGDIIILLRNRGRFADLMVRALKQYKVPVTGVDRMHLTQQLSVMDLLALMQFALLPEDDLNLATVLRGPLLNASEENLMLLAIGRKNSLWESLKSQAQKNPAFAAMVDYLSRWLSEADFITPFAFLARALNEPCPGNAVSGRRALWARLGPDALDPIEELLNAAQDFSARHAPSLQTFLHWITQADTIIKRELDRGGGQVRIMTVHGAKGLEAPVVFLPDMTGVPRVQDVPKFLWNNHEIPLYLPRQPQAGTAHRLWDEARRKQMEEYRRLLYVALTRAASRLYICGWEQSKTDANADECWYNLALEGLKGLGEIPLSEDRSNPPPLAGGVRGGGMTPDVRSQNKNQTSGMLNAPPPSLPREGGGTRAVHVIETDPQPVIAFADPELPVSGKAAPTKKMSAVKMPLPEWAIRSVPAEPEIFKSAAPSQIGLPPTVTPDSAFARGRIIHRLLQSLPDVEDSKRDSAAARFLANPQHRLTPEQQQKISDEVLALLRNPEWAPLFGPDSRAEVPMTGVIDGQNVARQVDRLYLRDNEVWIVDYKTNRPPPATEAETPLAYRQQLAEYRVILRDIYPGKTVRCFLLWTFKPELMELVSD